MKSFPILRAGCLVLAAIAKLIVAPSLPAQAAPGSVKELPPYWVEATTAWQRGQALQPGGMLMRFTELDRNGAPKSVTISEYALKYGGAEPEYELLRSTKDGKDQTAKARAENAKRRAAASGKARDGGQSGPPGADPLALMPFSDKIPGPLEVSSPRPEDGGVAVPYSIRHPKQGSRGIVHFDAALKPVTIDYSPDPLPPMVSVFDGRMRLAALPDGALVVSYMEFSGEGGILFLRMRFLVSIEFSGYERR